MYERTIYTVCHMFSDNTDEVNDLYQEILVRLWKGFDAFKGKSDIKAAGLSEENKESGCFFYYYCLLEFSSIDIYPNRAPQ